MQPILQNVNTIGNMYIYIIMYINNIVPTVNRKYVHIYNYEHK
jgi:hypothetical protein